MGLVLQEGPVRPVTPPGTYMGVCIDVVDLGIVETTWQGKAKRAHKCRLVFEIAEPVRPDGLRYIVSRQFTASLHENAGLRAFLESWRGGPFTPEELKGFDTEALIGLTVMIQVVHAERNGKNYDNIDTVMKPMKGAPKVTPDGKYVRVKDRPTEAAPAGESDVSPFHEDEDGVPF